MCMTTATAMAKKLLLDAEPAPMQLLNETSLDKIMAIHIAKADAALAAVNATAKYYDDIDGFDGAPTHTKLF